MTYRCGKPGRRRIATLPMTLALLAPVLAHNNLSGEIPPKLGDLAGLERLWLEKNRLTGRFRPKWVG
ncbi:hypothetical protein [Candidatus Palauibacter sp.]|uniref:hypothetical protein n=1 Tax=Candidatus Palauibacter sp. TaxID=3101350 RepID=UPI003AF3007C